MAKKVIIVGAGEVGTQIAEQLIDEGKDVIIIEKDSSVVKRISNSFDAIVITGEGTDVNVLLEAGAESADVFITATESDEVNLIASFIVSAEFKIPVKIARIQNPQYSQISSFKSSSSGVDFLVNTEQEVAWDIFQNIEQGANNSAVSFNNPDVQLRELIIEPGSLLDGVTVSELDDRIDEEFVIAAVIRGEDLFIPRGDFVLMAGDHIHIVALLGTFYRVYKKFGNKTHKLRKIAIIGGTSIGISVAKLLLSKGRTVIIIDKDYAICKSVAEMLPEALVLHGDISEHEIYEEEDINSVDAIVTTTLNEELNIISGIYAKTLGVKKAIAVVDKTSYLRLAPNLGIDSTVSKKYATINAILKTIRRGRVKSVHVLFDGEAEAVEAILPAHSSLVNTPIQDLDLPKNFLILAVQHGKHTVIPTGQTIMKANDNIIAIMLRDDVAKFEEYLV